MPDQKGIKLLHRTACCRKEIVAVRTVRTPPAYKSPCLNQVLFGVELRQNHILAVADARHADVQAPIDALVRIVRQRVDERVGDNLVDVERRMEGSECARSRL